MFHIHMDLARSLVEPDSGAQSLTGDIQIPSIGKSQLSEQQPLLCVKQAEEAEGGISFGAEEEQP